MPTPTATSRVALPTLSRDGGLVCPECATAHRPFGGHGQLEELGECDVTLRGWLCPCGAEFLDRDVFDCLDALAEDRALAAAGV